MGSNGTLGAKKVGGLHMKISNLILDTHVILWLFDGDETLSTKSRDLIKETMSTQ